MLLLQCGIRYHVCFTSLFIGIYLGNHLLGLLNGCRILPALGDLHHYPAHKLLLTSQSILRCDQSL